MELRFCRALSRLPLSIPLAPYPHQKKKKASVSVPLGAVIRRGGGVLGGALPQAGTGLEPIDETGESPMRVLVVEDNRTNAKVAGRMLERLGCSVNIAANGKEAFDMVAGFTYDLVFMDCQMPVMDGFAATRMIRKLDSHRGKVPIVALTAHAMAEESAGGIRG